MLHIQTKIFFERENHVRRRIRRRRIKAFILWEEERGEPSGRREKKKKKGNLQETKKKNFCGSRKKLKLACPVHHTLLFIFYPSAYGFPLSTSADPIGIMGDWME